MKYLILPLLVYSQLSFAGYGKPTLMARQSDVDAWNLPNNVWCFYSEPSMVKGEVYLPCYEGEGQSMFLLNDKGTERLAQSSDSTFFSNVVSSHGKASWYEYSEMSVVKFFEMDQTLNEVRLGRLSSTDFNTTMFRPFGENSWFFQVKGQGPNLKIWKDGNISEFFNPNVYFIFTPSVGTTGDIAFKTRDVNDGEGSPDKIWLYERGEWKVVLEDRDANPASPWISFRHQLSVSEGKVVTIATDAQGEALILISNGQTKVIARRGVDVKTFDYFNIKFRGDTIAFRAEDMQGRKAVFVHNSEDGLVQLVTQGDIVMTDRGPGRAHYSSRDAIFYGAPGIGENGEIVQQITLTDPDHPRTLLGVGVVKFQK